MDLCSSKNSFLHTRNYTTASISSARKGKSANSGLYHSVYLFGTGYGCKSPNKTFSSNFPFLNIASGMVKVPAFLKVMPQSHKKISESVKYLLNLRRV